MYHINPQPRPPALFPIEHKALIRPAFNDRTEPFGQKRLGGKGKLGQILS